MGDNFNPGYISDDGSEFTVFKSDDENFNPDDDLNLDDSQGDDGAPDILKDIDISKIPEEQRPAIEKVLEIFKQQSTQISELKKNSDLTTVLKQIASARQVPPPDNRQPLPPEKKKGFADDLQFEQDDYYAKFFKQLADSVGMKLNDLESKLNNNLAETTREKALDFISKNKVPQEVIVRMDEIAAEMGINPTKNLNRLYQMAKIDLGIKDTPVIDLEKKKRDLNGRLNMRNFHGTKDYSSKPVKTMEDAWGQAEDQLADEENLY